MARGHTPLRVMEKKKRAFLKALSEGMSISGSCAQASLSKRTIYDWRKADQAFAADWDQALDAGADALEDIATQRAVGWKKPIYDGKGEITGYEHSHSDTLMIFMLKGRRPSKYAPRPDQAPVNLTVILQQIANHSRCLPGDGAQDITPSVELLEAGDDTLDIE